MEQKLGRVGSLPNSECRDLILRLYIIMLSSEDSTALYQDIQLSRHYIPVHVRCAWLIRCVCVTWRCVCVTRFKNLAGKNKNKNNTRLAGDILLLSTTSFDFFFSYTQYWEWHYLYNFKTQWPILRRLNHQCWRALFTQENVALLQLITCKLCIQVSKREKNISEQMEDTFPLPGGVEYHSSREMKHTSFLVWWPIWLLRAENGVSLSMQWFLFHWCYFSSGRISVSQCFISFNKFAMSKCQNVKN